MRILQLVTMRQRRGAEVFATQLSDALVARGHEVVLAGLFPAPVEPLDPERAIVEDLIGAPNGRFHPGKLRELSSLIRQVRPDIVQANGSQTLKYSSLARRLSRRPFPLVYRNISVASQWLRNPAHRLLGRWLAGSLSHVSSVSDESSRDFGITYGIPANRRSVIRRGILIPPEVRAEEARRQLRELAGIATEARILVHTGSYTPEKNHAWLVDTFRDLHAIRPDVHLILLGEGALQGAVERQVAQAGLRGTVHILGMRREAAELVAGADLFVLPSLIEGIPGAVLEAAAQSVPSVAARVGGMTEAIDDGRSGILFPSGDREAFISGVLGLLNDEGRRRQMGRAARTLVQQRFSMDTTAAAFEQLYARLMRDHQN